MHPVLAYHTANRWFNLSQKKTDFSICVSFTSCFHERLVSLHPRLFPLSSSIFVRNRPLLDGGVFWLVFTFSYRYGYISFTCTLRVPGDKRPILDWCVRCWAGHTNLNRHRTTNVPRFAFDVPLRLCWHPYVSMFSVSVILYYNCLIEITRRGWTFHFARHCHRHLHAGLC